MVILFLRAKLLVKDLKHREGLRARDAVINVFALATGNYQTLSAQNSELLRKGRLSDSEERLNLAHAHLALG
jgi:hypothetical protein